MRPSISYIKTWMQWWILWAINTKEAESQFCSTLGSYLCSRVYKLQPAQRRGEPSPVIIYRALAGLQASELIHYVGEVSSTAQLCIKMPKKHCKKEKRVCRRRMHGHCKIKARMTDPSGVGVFVINYKTANLYQPFYDGLRLIMPW